MTTPLVNKGKHSIYQYGLSWIEFKIKYLLRKKISLLQQIISLVFFSKEYINYIRLAATIQVTIFI